MDRFEIACFALLSLICVVGMFVAAVLAYASVGGL
jgi:hypothetical protein